MKKPRRNLDREGLEIYLLNLLLAYRPFIQISSLMLLVSSFVIFPVSRVAGSIALVTATFLFAAAISDSFIRILVKVGAWLGTVWYQEGSFFSRFRK